MSSSTLVSTPRTLPSSGSRRPARPVARLSTPPADRGRTAAECPPDCDYCYGPETD
ncbi:hypothetical protein [Cryptosporangium arvum]|uniref:Uncharacterized protein n=1 Tax=Cryptosporangium arvum DSM 44712 TaxID=927661 RepID=A0A010ZXL3_9ACTN|nr:hypothetical protein [Cryptosporangium arvum]EXG81962.1 hypothetical protein CryarDRAFT_3087 [Cryptosporangium arvum DSM 44712]